MYTQFFGNYLLNKNVITREQLLSALEKQATTRMKLGALAVHAGYITGVEAEQIFILQTREDKRFGELAVEHGYLTNEQVDELLNLQVPDYILLGQILVDQGVLTAPQLQNHVTDYRSEYEIYDLNMTLNQKDMFEHLIQDIDFDESQPNKKYVVDYFTLLFNNLTRFIGGDYTPLDLIKMSEVAITNCASQDMTGEPFRISSALDMEQSTAITFASRYAKEEFSSFDEYVKASMEDFLNLHNGLFTVNMSNTHSIEITLEPPMQQTCEIYTPGKTAYLLPILYPFGLVHFVFSITFHE